MACAVSPTRKAVRVTAMRSRSAGRIRPLPNRISTTGWRIDRGQDGDRDHHVDQQPERPGEQAGERRLVTHRGVTGQAGQQDDAERHADDPERDLEQREREVEVGHGAVAEQAGDRGHDDERDLGHAQPDRPWRHQDERLARLRVAPARSVGRTGSPAGPAAGPGPADGRASRRRRSTASPSTPNLGTQDERAADDREVVDDRRDRGRGEPAAGVEHARRDRAHAPGRSG